MQSASQLFTYLCICSQLYYLYCTLEEAKGIIIANTSKESGALNTFQALNLVFTITMEVGTTIISVPR